MTQSDDYDAFRLEVREWLAANARLRVEAHPQTDRTADEYTAETVQDAKAFQRRLYEAGLAGLMWPAEAGGRGLDPRFEVVMQQESADYNLPTSLFNIGIGMCGPTITVHGTDDQKKRWLRRILTG